MTTKTTVLTICFWTITIFGFAQVKQKHPQQFYNKEGCSIMLLEGLNKESILCIALPPNDLHKKNGGIIIELKKVDRFVNALIKAKMQYEKLNNTYANKNIASIDRDLKIRCKVKGYFMYGNLRQYQSCLHPLFHYSIKENKEYSLTLNTGKLASSDKWFVNSEGYNISFSSSQEIDNFIALFSKEEINKLATISN